MEELRQYLKSLPVAERHAFAARIGTTLKYLGVALAAKKRLGIETAIRIERESGRRVMRSMVRPDVDWEYIRAADHEAAGA